MKALEYRYWILLIQEEDAGRKPACTAHADHRVSRCCVLFIITLKRRWFNQKLYKFFISRFSPMYFLYRTVK